MTTDAERWERAGREAVVRELEGARFDLEDVLLPLVDRMREPNGSNPDPEDVRDLRQRINYLRWAVETLLAPAAGCDQWGEPIPSLPAGKQPAARREE